MKKVLFLLPIAILALTGCGSNDNTDDSKKGTDTNTDTDDGTTPVDNDVQIAYEAGKALDEGTSKSKSETSNDYTFNGVVVATCGRSFYVQKADYAMLVYNYSDFTSKGIAIGKDVEVSAKIQNYYGTIETSTISSVTVNGEGTLPEAKIVSTKSELDELNQGVLVTAEKWTSDEEITGYSSSATKNPKGKLGSDTEEVVASFDKYGYTDDKGAIVNAVVVNDSLKLENCAVAVYKGVNQLIVVTSSTVTKL